MEGGASVLVTDDHQLSSPPRGSGGPRRNVEKSHGQSSGGCGCEAHYSPATAAPAVRLAVFTLCSLDAVSGGGQIYLAAVAGALPNSLSGTRPTAGRRETAPCD